jgi:alginate O-acetyltransferase complex protein AlgJ
VLLLGDSFANIYSGEDLDWGQNAGLAEHISLASGRGVDRLVLNAGGASATRAALARDSGRLEGKTAVVYEFAARDLSSGDWKIIPLPQTARLESTAAQTGKISGTIREITRVPDRGSFPYDNVIVSLHLQTPQGGEVVLFCFGLKDNAATGSENLMPGDVIEAEVIPWDEAEPRYGSICRRELESDAAMIDTLYWTEEVPRRKR